MKYHINGKPEEIHELDLVSNITKITTWFVSGNIRRTYYKDDKGKQGIDTRYRNNGLTYAERYWVDDKQHGVIKEYYISGKLQSLTSYKFGTKHPVTIKFMLSGALDSVTTTNFNGNTEEVNLYSSGITKVWMVSNVTANIIIEYIKYDQAGYKVTTNVRIYRDKRNIIKNYATNTQNILTDIKSTSRGAPIGYDMSFYTDGQLKSIKYHSNNSLSRMLANVGFGLDGRLLKYMYLNKDLKKISFVNNEECESNSLFGHQSTSLGWSLNTSSVGTLQEINKVIPDFIKGLQTRQRMGFTDAEILDIYMLLSRDMREIELKTV